MHRTLPAVVALLLVTASARADWPVFRGDALMTGTAAAKLPRPARRALVV